LAIATVDERVLSYPKITRGQQYRSQDNNIGHVK